MYGAHGSDPPSATLHPPTNPYKRIPKVAELGKPSAISRRSGSILPSSGEPRKERAAESHRVTLDQHIRQSAQCYRVVRLPPGEGHRGCGPDASHRIARQKVDLCGGWSDWRSTFFCCSWPACSCMAQAACRMKSRTPKAQAGSPPANGGPQRPRLSNCPFPSPRRDNHISARINPSGKDPRAYFQPPHRASRAQGPNYEAW